MAFAAEPSTPAVQTSAKQDERNLTLLGQRKVNMLWEYTQAIIAIAVVMANLFVAIHTAMAPKGASEIPAVLSNSMFLIIGFYFSRTNHQAIGGVGAKADKDQEYTGR